MLPYYNLEKNKENRIFYFSNDGLFNFWDEYLICHVGEKNYVLINRPGRKFEGETKETVYYTVSDLPKEAYDEFPELMKKCIEHYSNSKKEKDDQYEKLN